MLKRQIIVLVAAIAGAGSSFAQMPTMNRAAVDTLTKDVATVVFANQTGDKATEILDQLSACASGCDVVAIIKQVGGWDAVGVKMEELGRVKNTARFQAMSPGDANAAIRRELARFYEKYKTDRNYGVPLSQDVQGQILAKIDRMLPPTIVPEPTPLVAGQSGRQTEPIVIPAEGGNVNTDAIRVSQLEREVKEERGNRIWMIILSAIAGLLVGAGVVYFMLYRALKKDYDRLVGDNARLSNELDAARRPKVTNEPRQPQPENRRRPDGYAPPQRTEPSQTVKPPEPTPSVIPDPSASQPNILNPPVAPVNPPVYSDPIQTQTQQVLPVPTPSPARDEVFYFPPPDPNGQFDSAQRADMLSPESAYRFSAGHETPDAATFRFEAEPGRVARFLTYRNYMIEPACDSENSYSSAYTRIVNRRDGEALLENGVWRVKTKALIRYE